MSFSAITLNAEDDIISICDRLEWAQENRLALVLSPEVESGLTDLDLIRLRRKAEALRLQVGIVSRDGSLRRRARAAGLPSFGTLRVAERRRSWHAPRSRPLPARPVAEEDQAVAHQRLRAQPIWRRWLRRYAALFLFFVVLAVVIVSLAYTVPSARVTLYPELEPVSVTRQIVADPQLDSVSYSGASVPGRRLVVVQEWQATVETTGVLEAPDAPARGQVVFVNTLPEPVSVPAGTRVSTSGGTNIAFQLIESLEVPGAVGATVEGDIIAIVPGPEGNVAANAINRVEGPLALQLQVRNLDDVGGGATRLARAVTEADVARLRAQVIQQLQALALAEMQVSLGSNEFLAQDSLRVMSVVHETYSAFEGEQAERLTLEMRAELVATAVDETQATGLVYETLAQAVMPGYELVPDSLVFAGGDVLGVDNQGRVSFEMVGRGVTAAELNLEGPLSFARGQQLPQAIAYLDQQLPLRAQPSVELFPPWFKRMPYLRSRIRIDVRQDL